MKYTTYEQNAINIANAANEFTIPSEVYNKSLEFYNNGLSEDALDYLRKFGKDKKYVLPGKQRRIDRLTPRLRYLKSRELVRRIPLSIKLADRESIVEKIKKIKRVVNIEYLNAVQEVIEQTVPEYAQIDDINLNSSQYLEQISQSYIEQGYPESAVKVYAANALKQQLEYLISEASRKSQYVLAKNKYYKDIKKNIEEKIRKEYIDELEKKVDVLLRSHIHKKEFENEKSIAFDYALKTAIGAEYYYVDITGNSNEPVFEAVSPLDVIYPMTSNTWVQDGDWVVLLRHYTARELEERYEINGAVKALIDKYEIAGKTEAAYVSGYAYPNTIGEMGTYTIKHIFWKEKEKKLFAYYPNKYNPDSPHIHMIKENEKSKLIKKGIKVKELPFYVIYEAVMLDDMFIVRPRKITDVVRYDDSYIDPKLPVIGLVFDKKFRKPYSLVLETKDSVELSTIINMKMELLITLSGVKGMIMDDSQRPGGMTRDEWMFLRKQGTAWIQSMKNGRPATFNQFQNYDDTLSQSIVTLLNIDESLERHFELVTGVTRQSLAMMEQYDLKGTTMAAINQTLSIVESIYQTHELIYVKALEHYVNLLIRYTDAQKVYIDYEDSKMGYMVEEIDLAEFEDRTVKIVINKSLTDESVRELYKQLAIQGVMSNRMPISAVSAILTSDSFREMDSKLMTLIDEYEQKITQNQMAIDNNKAKQEAEIIKLKGEIEKMLKQYDVQIEQTKLNVEAEKMRREFEVKYKQLENESQKIGNDNEIDRAKIGIENKKIETERFIEMAYLKEQQRQSVVNSQLEAIRLKLDAILKNTSEPKSVKTTRSKEHIKD